MTADPTKKRRNQSVQLYCPSWLAVKEFLRAYVILSSQSVGGNHLVSGHYLVMPHEHVVMTHVSTLKSQDSQH